jgi:Tfp pilus assembly protein PilW
VVELVIAIALGLSLLAAFLGGYLSSRGVARVAQQAGSAEATARFVMTAVGDAIKTAGYGEIAGSDWTTDRQTLFDGPAVRGCTESRFADAFHPTAPDYRCAGNAPGDQVLVRFQARYALVPMDSVSLAASTLPDCLGASNPAQDAALTPDVARPGAGIRRRLVQSAFALDTSGSVLRCHGNGNPTTPAPVANDVVEFRVFYRFDDAGFGLAAGSHLNYAPVGGSVRSSDWIDAAAAGSPVDPWRHVVAVIVCVTVATREAGTTLRGAATMSTRCPRSALEASAGVLPADRATDGRLRRSAIETFTVRSQATGALSVPG